MPAIVVTPPPELLNTQAAAEYIGVKPHTLEVWRTSGRYRLPFIRVGGNVRYRRTALDEFLADRTEGGPNGGEAA
jgi:excisionase family DNA binding protein